MRRRRRCLTSLARKASVEMLSSTEMMMEFLFSRRAPNLPPSGLAEEFDRLIWCMNDNGAELLRIREKWLQEEDKEKVRIALAMTEAFPFANREEMTGIFAKVASRWPDLAEVCRAWIEQWDRQSDT
jgi:hypothetical protein